MIGKFDYVFACGTSFSLSAVMRRSALPSSLVAHVHGFVSGEQDLTRHTYSAEKTFHVSASRTSFASLRGASLAFPLPLTIRISPISPSPGAPALGTRQLVHGGAWEQVVGEEGPKRMTHEAREALWIETLSHFGALGRARLG